MAPERDLTTELAEEIRAAVARVSPSPASPARSPVPGEELFAAPLSRASEHVTPSIPPAARLAGAKRFVLRTLRFLWRGQASFNALVIEAIGGLAEFGRVVQAGFEQRLEAEDRARQEVWTRWKAQLGDRVERVLSEAQRRSAIQDGRLALLEAGYGRPAREPLPGPEGPRPLPPGVYSLFEERFRGSVEKIAEKQRGYLPRLKNLPGPVLDVGCGRGELLRLLESEGIPASGVEINPVSARACREEGLAVQEGDGLALLSSKPAASLGGVVALQVVEHWSAERVFAFLREARRALAPGGILIAETINSDSLSSLRAFFLDPSHVRPVPPDSLLFLAEAAGFVEGRIEYLAPLDPGDRLEETSPNDAKLNRLLFGPQDYALIARVPATENGKRETGTVEASG